MPLSCDSIAKYGWHIKKGKVKRTNLKDMGGDDICLVPLACGGWGVNGVVRYR